MVAVFFKQRLKIMVYYQEKGSIEDRGISLFPPCAYMCTAKKKYKSSIDKRNRELQDTYIGLSSKSSHS